MGTISNNEKLAFLKKGKEAEMEFAKLFKDAVSSTESEDIYDHIDVKINTNVDIKQIKKNKRANNDVNENIHWIEIKGITGHPGWAYGKSDFFSFELKDYWIVVAKEDLHNFIEKNIIKEWVKTPDEALYKLYRREGRKDIITLVTSYDLCYISTIMIKKY